VRFVTRVILSVQYLICDIFTGGDSSPCQYLVFGSRRSTLFSQYLIPVFCFLLHPSSVLLCAMFRSSRHNFPNVCAPLVVSYRAVTPANEKAIRVIWSFSHATPFLFQSQFYNNSLFLPIGLRAGALVPALPVPSVLRIVYFYTGSFFRWLSYCLQRKVSFIAPGACL